MTACALPRFMFTWVALGNVRLTPESMSQDSDRGAGLSVAIGRNRLPESSDKGGIGSPMPSCRQSRRRFLASFTDSPLFSIHRFILPCLTLHLFRKEVRVAVGLWDSSFKNAFHTLSYRFAAVILVILYSRGKGKELKDAEQGCIADTLTLIPTQANRCSRYETGGKVHGKAWAGPPYDRGKGQITIGASPKLPSARSLFTNHLNHSNP